MKIIIKNLLCYLIVTSMLLACVPGFASSEGQNVTTVFDFKGKTLGTEYYDAKYYPKLDGTRFTNMYFSKNGTLATKVIDGETVLAYTDKTAGADTYKRLSVSEKYEGRFVYTGKIYTNRASSDGNMNFALARFYVNYGSGGVNDGALVVTDEINKLKANRWYDFKYEIDLYKTKNNFSVSFAPAEPESSADVGFSKTGTLKKDVLGKLGFKNGRFDFDLNSKSTDNFVAYKDLNLTYTKNPGKIDTYLNDNAISSDSFKDGIYTAVGSGSGLFALAVYEDDELISLDVSNSQEELETRKLNTVIENGSNKTVKIFRFDEHNAPYCVKVEALYDSSEERRIYANMAFSEKGGFAESSNKYTSDGQLYLKAEGVKGVDSSYSRPRLAVTALKPSRYIVFEADYSIPETQAKCHRVRLIGGYYNSTETGNEDEPDTFVLTTSGGKIYSGRDSKATNTYGTLSSKPTNVAVLIDNVSGKYDIYINRKLVRSGDGLYRNSIKPGTEYNARSFYIGHLSGDNTSSYCVGTLIVDNLKIYDVNEEDVNSGDIFKDIGNKIPNVHVTDYSDISPDKDSDIYIRPNADLIAKKALATPHPRLMINRAKVEEIENSTDENVIKWRTNVMASAEKALNENPYKYKISSTDSVEDLPNSMTRMMNLGYAYLSTGDTRYSDRAYEEAKVLYNIYRIINKSLGDIDGNRDYWNSYSCLDVTEISFILSVCYDWMYDAWTEEQKQELYKNVYEKGISNMYNVYFAKYMPAPANDDWWKISNNQGSVCNGSAILTGLAFMENDAYKCSNIVESGIRAIEIVLKNFAPDGGWNESASYWAYTLKTFTLACATLDNIYGTNFGLQDTIGLKNSCYYSLAIEGETGAMSYGDGSGDKTNAPFLFYWAKAYKDKGIGGAAMKIKENFNGSIYDLIYYDANYVGAENLPEAFKYEGIELVSFRSGKESGETYVTMLGGKGHSTGHDHLDSGSIILEMNGERVFKDMGAEYYGADGYFAGNRHLYFRARPEAHNIFIINPENTKASNGTSAYYGQSKSAYSDITDYNPELKTATMDLSEAYARDAESASRKIKLDGKKFIVEDSITLKAKSNIYWNWYVLVKNSEKDKTFTAGNIEISSDGKYAIVTRNSKKFKVTFETDANYTLAIENADYYVNVDPEPSGTKHSNEPSRRLAVQLKDVEGTVSLITTVESMD